MAGSPKPAMTDAQLSDYYDASVQEVGDLRGKAPSSQVEAALKARTELIDRFSYLQAALPEISPLTDNEARDIGTTIAALNGLKAEHSFSDIELRGMVDFAIRNNMSFELFQQTLDNDETKGQLLHLIKEQTGEQAPSPLSIFNFAARYLGPQAFSSPDFPETFVDVVVKAHDIHCAASAAKNRGRPTVEDTLAKAVRASNDITDLKKLHQFLRKNPGRVNVVGESFATESFAGPSASPKPQVASSKTTEGQAPKFKMDPDERVFYGGTKEKPSQVHTGADPIPRRELMKRADMSAITRTELKGLGLKPDDYMALVEKHELTIGDIRDIVHISDKHGTGTQIAKLLDLKGMTPEKLGTFLDVAEHKGIPLTDAVDEKLYPLDHQREALASNPRALTVELLSIFADYFDLELQDKRRGPRAPGSPLEEQDDEAAVGNAFSSSGPGRVIEISDYGAYFESIIDRVYEKFPRETSALSLEAAKNADTKGTRNIEVVLNPGMYEIPLDEDVEPADDEDVEPADDEGADNDDDVDLTDMAPNDGEDEFVGTEDREDDKVNPGDQEAQEELQRLDDEADEALGL